MFIDTRRVEQGTVVESTVCIIGGGVAGITLAMELDKQGVDVVLLRVMMWKSAYLTFSVTVRPWRPFASQWRQTFAASGVISARAAPGSTMSTMKVSSAPTDLRGRSG